MEYTQVSGNRETYVYNTKPIMGDIMRLIKDLGKRLVGNRKRRFGLFYCEYCDREVEKRIDAGSVYKSCGCLDRRQEWNKFDSWKCTACGITKPLTEYYRNKTGHRRVCKLCVKNQQLKNKFGVSLKWYSKQLKEQGNVCDICKEPLQSDRYNFFAVDHCHTEDKVRGLLCTQCNTSLGLLKDNPTTIKNMLKYLDKHK